MSEPEGAGTATMTAHMSSTQGRDSQGFRPPRHAAWAAVLRAALGIAVFAGVAVAGALPLWGIALCCAGAALFALYGAREIVRHAAVIVIDDKGIERRGLMPRRLAWGDLAAVKLAHYSTRRDGRNGWQELVMRGRGTSMVLESEHPAFEPAASQALARALENDVRLSPATWHNARMLGLLAEDGAATR